MTRASFIDRVAAAPISWGICEAPGWGLQLPVDRVLTEARALLNAREFPSGSVGPKVEAAATFVESGGREGIITSLPAIRAALDGRAGTRIVP